MLKVPVVWVQCSGVGNPAYHKEAGDRFFIVGEEGENILLVSRPARLFVPIFEATSKEEGAHRGYILERMLALAECCLLETGQVGTVYGIFRNSLTVLGEVPMYVVNVGLICTAEEFNPEGDRLDPEKCAEFGLPVDVEIDTERGQPG